MQLPAFEAAFFSFYRLNDGKAILTDDLLVEKGRLIRAAQGKSENDLCLSNGWLHKYNTRHGIKKHILHSEAESVDRAQLAANRMKLNEMIEQYHHEMY